MDVSPSDNSARVVFRLLPLSLFDRSPHRRYGCLKRRKFILNDFPNYLVRNGVIFVPKHVPDAGDAAPSDAWMHSLQMIGHVTAGFRNDFNRPLSSMAEQPILLKISKRLTSDCYLYPVDRNYYFVQNSAILRVIRTRALPTSRCRLATLDASCHVS
jgi:hypothetical protein